MCLARVRLYLLTPCCTHATGTCVEFALRRRPNVQTCHVPEHVAAADDAAIAAAVSNEPSGRHMEAGTTTRGNSVACTIAEICDLNATSIPIDLQLPSGFMLPRECFCEPLEGELLAARMLINASAGAGAAPEHIG